MPPTDSSIWDKEIPVAAGTISYVDAAVLQKLPPGTEVVDISPSGASYWARTAKIETTTSDGESASYFIKVHQGHHGQTMIEAEGRAMELLYKIAPEMVAKPLGWGTYQDMPDAHFFVSEFHPMSDDIPEITDFPALVAEMHKRAVSPDGNFGMPFATFGGNKPQYFPVSSSWEECFTSGMRGIFAAERETHGTDEEFDQMTETILAKVIPRLLRPLETNGSSIVARLVHGDLWDGNASVDVETGHPMIYDSTPLYAHNEYELGAWNIPRHKITSAYIEAYVKHMPKSEPTEEFWDRVQLYTMRFDVHASSLYKGNLRFRNIAREYMRTLVDKYGDGYEAYAADMNRKAATSNYAIEIANNYTSFQGSGVPLKASDVLPGDIIAKIAAS